jgi:hypothetical protein
VKDRPDTLRKPFASKQQDCQWVAALVDLYNNQRRHSGIKFVVPQQRHSAQAVEIRRYRDVIDERARQRNPRRCQDQYAAGFSGSGLDRSAVA